MRLTNRDAQRLLSGLKKIDESDDTKLSGETRLKLGININRLMPNVRVFEREVQRIVASTNVVNGKTVDTVMVLAAESEIDRLAEVADEFDLKLITLEDLQLKSNNKIKSDTLAQIALIVSNFDS